MVKWSWVSIRCLVDVIVFQKFQRTKHSDGWHQEQANPCPGVKSMIGITHDSLFISYQSRWKWIIPWNTFGVSFELCCYYCIASTSFMRQQRLWTLLVTSQSHLLLSTTSIDSQVAKLLELLRNFCLGVMVDQMQSLAVLLHWPMRCANTQLYIEIS